jgi:NifU-like protein
VYGNTRFSEDLDFDNFGLSEEEFGKVAEIIQKGLEKEGLSAEIKVVSRGAFRCKIRLPKILFENELSGLPEEKMHCSVMGKEALEAAVAQAQGKDIKTELEGEVICKCFGITDKEIDRVVQENHLTTVADVTHYTKAGGGCEQCHEKIEAIIAKSRGEVTEQPAAPKPPQKTKLSNIQRMKLIEETIEREIRPSLRTDGGDIDLLDIEGSKVLVTLRGACTACPSSDFTLKGLVQAKLREFVSDDIEVVVDS